MSGLDLAYNIRSYHQGPYPTSITENDDKTLMIQYDNNQIDIEVRNQTGFEVCFISGMRLFIFVLSMQEFYLLISSFDLNGWFILLGIKRTLILLMV